MAKEQRHGWMVATRSLIGMIGAEYELMAAAGIGVLVRFYVAALLILIILLTSIVSIHYAVDLLFHVAVVETLLSVFLSCLFVFMYVFLLNTFGKENVESRNRYFQVSNLIRIGFVIFMAFLISKPLEILAFQSYLENEVFVHKAEVIRTHEAQVDRVYAGDLQQLNGRLIFFQKPSTTNESLFAADRASIQQKIAAIEEKKTHILAVARERIDASPFFIFRLQTLMRRYPQSYLLCLFVVILFLLPGYLIYSISKEGKYHRLKWQRERSLIKERYQDFCMAYRQLSVTAFAHQPGRLTAETDFYTIYEDPPFNTKRKPDHTYQPEEEFFKRFG